MLRAAATSRQRILENPASIYLAYRQNYRMPESFLVTVTGIVDRVMSRAAARAYPRAAGATLRVVPYPPSSAMEPTN